MDLRALALRFSREISAMLAPHCKMEQRSALPALQQLRHWRLEYGRYRLHIMSNYF